MKLLNDMKQNDNEIKTYTSLVKFRNLLKQIQQTSWNITQFDKRYPLEDAFSDDYPFLLDAYMDFKEDLDRIVNLFEDLENENENNKN